MMIMSKYLDDPEFPAKDRIIPNQLMEAATNTTITTTNPTVYILFIQPR